MSVGAVNKQTGDRIPTAGMPAIDDALDLMSVNPVQNAVITAALALKQNATDNNLETEAKTIVGAINEHEGDIGSLKSGLTNVNDYLFSSEILSNADLNNYITSASYRIGNIATCTNRPDTTVAGTSGVLEIEAHGQYILQKFYGDIGYTQRISYDGGTTWVAWDSRLTSKQDKTDNTLTTTAKTVIGAINELDGKLTSYTLTPATDVTINRASCVKIMNTVIVDAVITLGDDKSASSSLLNGLPTIGSNNIPIYAVDDNATARPVRVYASGVYTSGAFVASERIHIMGCYTLTD